MRRFYRVNGTGMFARYRAFTWSSSQLLPVERPDFVPEEELWGYRLQRDQVVANTRALIQGRQVNNVLLYGDPGTGKSRHGEGPAGVPGLRACGSSRSIRPIWGTLASCCGSWPTGPRSSFCLLTIWPLTRTI